MTEIFIKHTFPQLCCISMGSAKQQNFIFARQQRAPRPPPAARRRAARPRAPREFHFRLLSLLCFLVLDGFLYFLIVARRESQATTGHRAIQRYLMR